MKMSFPCWGIFFTDLTLTMTLYLRRFLFFVILFWGLSKPRVMCMHSTSLYIWILFDALSTLSIKKTKYHNMVTNTEKYSIQSFKRPTATKPLEDPTSDLFCQKGDILSFSFIGPVRERTRAIGHVRERTRALSQ